MRQTERPRRALRRQLRLQPLCVLLLAVACGRSAPHEAIDPVEVGAAEDDGRLAEVRASDDAARRNENDAPTAVDSGRGAGTGDGGGGLRVLDGNGELVGVLVSRGHPAQGQQGADPLRDGVMVYHPKARLFFGVAMASGKVLIPRLGIADPKCDLPVVAGYYPDGPEISGFDYGFPWRGDWWRLIGGKPLELVGCSGVVTGGEAPKCVPHSGTCRGFKVEKVSAPLPQSFQAPLRFDWQGADG